METSMNASPQLQRVPDGTLNVRHGKTTYKVRVFFDHNTALTAEDRLKRVILSEVISAN